MVEANVIIGIAVIILNALPLILKKPKYLVLTGALSLFMLLLLIFVGK